MNCDVIKKHKNITDICKHIVGFFDHTISRLEKK